MRYNRGALRSKKPVDKTVLPTYSNFLLFWGEKINVDEWEWIECPKCGFGQRANPELMKRGKPYCPTCGTEMVVKEEPTFCSECGRELTKDNMWSEDTCKQCAVVLGLEK